MKHSNSLKNSLYQSLLPYGITTGSSMENIDEVTFDIMGKKKLAQAKTELDTIKRLIQIDTRLKEDFKILETNVMHTELIENKITSVLQLIPKLLLCEIQQLIENKQKAPTNELEEHAEIYKEILNEIIQI